MWMLEYPFPYADSVVSGKFTRMREALLVTLHAPPDSFKSAWLLEAVSFVVLSRNEPLPSATSTVSETLSERANKPYGMERHGTWTVRASAGNTPRAGSMGP